MVVVIICCTLLVIICLGGARNLAAVLILGFSFFVTAVAVIGILKHGAQ